MLLPSKTTVESWNDKIESKTLLDYKEETHLLARDLPGIQINFDGALDFEGVAAVVDADSEKVYPLAVSRAQSFTGKSLGKLLSDSSIEFLGGVKSIVSVQADTTATNSGANVKQGGAVTNFEKLHP